MREFCARTAMLLLSVWMLALASPSALAQLAQSYEQALAGFTADAFGDTDAAITAVAASGNPLAITVIGALQDGRLLFDAEAKKVYVREASGKLLDAATGQPIAGEAPAALKAVRLNNRLRRSVEAAIGSLTLLAPDPNRRLAAAQAVFKSRDATALPALEAALAKESEARVKKVMLEARAAIILTQPSSKPSASSASAATRMPAACSAACPPISRPRCRPRQRRRSRPSTGISPAGRWSSTSGTACRSAPSCCSRR
jgi:urea transport system permease protein